jgi:hypothetical protein
MKKYVIQHENGKYYGEHHPHSLEDTLTTAWHYHTKKEAVKVKKGLEKEFKIVPVTPTH